MNVSDTNNYYCCLMWAWSNDFNLTKKMMAAYKELSQAEENGKKITVVVVGKEEIGKSTLLDNILLHPRVDETTEEATAYSKKIDGIES